MFQLFWFWIYMFFQEEAFYSDNEEDDDTDVQWHEKKRFLSSMSPPSGE